MSATIVQNTITFFKTEAAAQPDREAQQHR